MLLFTQQVVTSTLPCPAPFHALLLQLGSFDTGLGDGWGLTNDGTHLIVTDSSHRVSWLDPVTMKVVRQLEVTDGGRDLPWLNEVRCGGEGRDGQAGMGKRWSELK